MISSDCYAKGIRVINGQDTMRLENNYFDLNGDTRRISILEGSPKSCSLKVYMISDDHLFLIYGKDPVLIIYVEGLSVISKEEVSFFAF